jgi:hypothetical protein
MDYYHDILGELSNPNPVRQPGEAQAGWQEGMSNRVTEWVGQAPQPWQIKLLQVK